MGEKTHGVSAKYQTPDDYIMSERQNATRNEYVAGRVMPRSGSNRWHNLIVSNIAIAIGSRIHGGKNDIYIGNMRVRVKNNFICYPDVVVVSGEPTFADQAGDLLLNPTVVIEIVSGGTNFADKTQKLESFLAMSSVKEVVLVKEDEMRIEHYSKQNAKQWIYKIYNERDDVMSLESAGCKISLSEVYSQIKFGQAPLSSMAVN